MNKKIIFAVAGVVLSITVVLSAVGVSKHFTSDKDTVSREGAISKQENVISDETPAFNVNDVLH